MAIPPSVLCTVPYAGCVQCLLYCVLLFVLNVLYYNAYNLCSSVSLVSLVSLVRLAPRRTELRAAQLHFIQLRSRSRFHARTNLHAHSHNSRHTLTHTLSNTLHTAHSYTMHANTNLADVQTASREGPWSIEPAIAPHRPAMVLFSN